MAQDVGRSKQFWSKLDWNVRHHAHQAKDLTDLTFAIREGRFGKNLSIKSVSYSEVEEMCRLTQNFPKNQYPQERHGGA